MIFAWKYFSYIMRPIISK